MASSHARRRRLGVESRAVCRLCESHDGASGLVEYACRKMRNRFDERCRGQGPLKPSDRPPLALLGTRLAGFALPEGRPARGTIISTLSVPDHDLEDGPTSAYGQSAVWCKVLSLQGQALKNLDLDGPACLAPAACPIDSRGSKMEGDKKQGRECEGNHAPPRPPDASDRAVRAHLVYADPPIHAHPRPQLAPQVYTQATRGSVVAPLLRRRRGGVIRLGARHIAPTPP
jgi:hypothetical protein